MGDTDATTRLMGNVRDIESLLLVTRYKEQYPIGGNVTGARVRNGSRYCALGNVRANTFPASTSCTNVGFDWRIESTNTTAMQDQRRLANLVKYNYLLLWAVDLVRGGWAGGCGIGRWLLRRSNAVLPRIACMRLE